MTSPKLLHQRNNTVAHSGGAGFELAVPLAEPQIGPVALMASYAVLSLALVHHRKAAVELRGELHAFVDIDCTFHRVSGGDQCRRGLQARGL